MSLLGRILQALGVEDHYKPIRWPTRAPMPPITLPKTFKFEDVKAIRKAKP